MEVRSDNSPTSSTDSWMFVKNEKEIGKDQVEKDELEDSDGISVISESEMMKNHSSHSDEDNAERPLVEEAESSSEEEAKDELELLTPPATPSVEIDKEKCENVTSNELELHQEIPTSTARGNTNHGAVLLIAMALVIAILYTNISSLKKEFATTASIYEQRIARLEDENQQLKAQLNELIVQLRSRDEIKMPSYKSANDPLVETVTNFEKFVERQEEANRQPITKDVWLGGEKEDVVKILDKKLNSLPDYCYFTDESDLFYEYNKENCERKKRKLDERVKKFHKKNDQKAESVDDIYKSPRDKNYDDYMSQTTDELLASLNDEIQEIKKSRVAPNDGKNENDTATKEKLSKKKSKNFEDESKKKRMNLKRQRAVEGSGNEWSDRRTAGREEARKKNDNEENWYLKRKNEREINRLEKNFQA